MLMVAEAVRGTHDVRRAGSAALDLAFTAAGRVEGFFELGLAPWDVAAGILLVTEAGGRVTGWPGDAEPPIVTGRVLASNGRIHEGLWALTGAVGGESWRGPLPPPPPPKKTTLGRGRTARFCACSDRNQASCTVISRPVPSTRQVRSSPTPCTDSSHRPAPFASFDCSASPDEPNQGRRGCPRACRWNIRSKWCGKASGGTAAAPAGGPTLVVDGNRQVSPSPVDTLIIAMASCSAIDVVDYLEKRRTPPSSLSVSVRFSRAPQPPKRVTAAHLTFRVATDSPRDHVERAVQLSFDKYCSVSNSLAEDTQPGFSVELEPASAAAG